MFSANGAEIFIYGTANDPITVDYQNGTTYGADGTAIEFAWELPWADFDERINIKKSEYISLEAQGNATFTISMYTDNIRIDPATGLDTPQLTTQFLGSTGSGYGVGAQAYGGGVDQYNDYLWKWPAKFKIAKLAFSGAATQPLNFISFSLLHKQGGYRR